MSDYFDFDAAQKEKEEKSFTIKAGGKEWPIPAIVPADATLYLMRVMAEKGSDGRLNRGEELVLLEKLLPAKVFAALCQNGLTINNYDGTLVWLLEKYKLQGSEPKEGEAQAPEEGAKTI